MPEPQTTSRRSSSKLTDNALACSFAVFLGSSLDGTFSFRLCPEVDRIRLRRSKFVHCVHTRMQFR